MITNYKNPAPKKATKMTRIVLLLSILCLAANTQAENTSSAPATDYHFIIQDSPAQLFTMRQVNESYLSGYRLLARGLYSATPERVADLIQAGINIIYLMPLTHEEGHRSILTVQDIGSISQPYFNRQGAAYVKGVTDETLKHLRDTDLPTYIRLHGAGLESDYLLNRRAETLASFDQDLFKHIKWEYWVRKVSIMNYYVSGLLKQNLGDGEEANELERDIVGHDLYGAARHLHRPTVDFHRYTSYSELTDTEKKFVHRLGYRSFLNLLNPLLLGRSNFAVGAGIRLNAGLGYCIAPFGDFIDENIWIQYHGLCLHGYARQFQNKDHWFPAAGLGLTDFRLLKQLTVSIAGHFWQQPDNCNFITANPFTGGAIDADVRYFFFSRHPSSWVRAFSVDLGVIYKSKGFLPEELYLDEHFGFRVGTTFRL